MTSGPIPAALDVSANTVVVGVDFGTLSARAVVVRVADGAQLGTAMCAYRHAVMTETLASTGEPLPPDWALQDAGDYLHALSGAVRAAIADSGVDAGQVAGIGTDFTASTPMPVRADGVPLSSLPEWRSRPHAYVKLWKHHAAQAQADRITALAAKRGEPWLGRYGGRISAEWQWAKALQLLEEDPEVYAAADRWIEAADWIVWQLTGRETRNVTTAGHKGLRQDGEYPSEDYSAALHPGFRHFVRDKLCHEVSRLGASAGPLTEAAAAMLELRPGIAVAIGNVDAHVTAAAADSVGEGQLLAVMGTSTCHVMNATTLAEIPGMCGVVRDGILANLWGYEAGQSGVGDIFGWYVDTAVPPAYHEQARSRGVGLHEHLSQLAAAQQPGQHGLVALDWHNGNRSVLVDHHLSGLLVGTTLATRPPDVYRALVEATAYGARRIVEAFQAGGLPVTEFVVAGGLLRNPLVMQVYADVLRMPISTIRSEQGPALGSAIHAAVAAGCHPDVATAAARMGGSDKKAYTPDPAAMAVYDRLYGHYRALHDHFGVVHPALMRDLRNIREVAVQRSQRRSGDDD